MGMCGCKRCGGNNDFCCDTTCGQTKLSSCDKQPLPLVIRPTFLAVNGICPWSQHSGTWSELVCGDGSRCDPHSEGWDCCLNRGKRTHCPAVNPIMCDEQDCGGGDHCCVGEVSLCKSGRRACPSGSYCPWQQQADDRCLSGGRVENHQHSGEDDVLICTDNSRCSANVDGWDCCSKRGAYRNSCPRNFPEMCGWMGLLLEAGGVPKFLPQKFSRDVWMY